MNLIEYKELSNIDFDEIAHVHIRRIERDYVYANDYPTRYTADAIKSILKYLKDCKFPEAIKELKKEEHSFKV